MYIMAEKNIASKSQQRNTEMVLANRDCGTSKCKGITVPAYARKAYGWKRGTVPFILILGTRCSKVAHLMPWPLYPQGNGSKYPPNMRLNGQQASLDILETRKKYLALPGIEWFLGHPEYRHGNVQTTASGLPPWHRKAKNMHATHELCEASYLQNSATPIPPLNIHETLRLINTCKEYLS